MESSVDNAIFTEMKCGINFAYILNNNSQFLATEYKVLQNQAEGSFLHSTKMTYNGKIELYYMTEGCKAFMTFVPGLDSDRFQMTVGNLLDAVCEVKNNGFLKCRNLDIRLEKIYVELSTYKIHLVYLPISQPFFKDDEEFENELRARIVKMIGDRSDKELPALKRLALNLTDDMISLEETAICLRGGIQRTSESALTSMSDEKFAYLVTMSMPHVEIKITKDEFVIGKKVSAVDGAVTFNPMISRVHCKVCKDDEGYKITDLKSANGTFINNVQLVPEHAYPLKNGDVLRLANTDFQVRIK